MRPPAGARVSRESGRRARGTVRSPVGLPGPHCPRTQRYQVLPASTRRSTPFSSVAGGQQSGHRHCPHPRSRGTSLKRSDSLDCPKRWAQGLVQVLARVGPAVIGTFPTIEGHGSAGRGWYRRGWPPSRPSDKTLSRHPEPMTIQEPYRRYLITSEVADLLRCSVRTIHELTRTQAIPHRRLPGTRRCLFRLDEL